MRTQCSDVVGAENLGGSLRRWGHDGDADRRARWRWRVRLVWSCWISRSRSCRVSERAGCVLRVRSRMQVDPACDNVDARPDSGSGRSLHARSPHRSTSPPVATAGRGSGRPRWNRRPIGRPGDSATLDRWHNVHRPQRSRPGDSVPRRPRCGPAGRSGHPEAVTLGGATGCHPSVGPAPAVERPRGHRCSGRRAAGRDRQRCRW